MHPFLPSFGLSFLDKRLETLQRHGVRVGVSHESLHGVVRVVKAKNLPGKGFSVYLGVKLAFSYRFKDHHLENSKQALQRFYYIISHLTLNVIEFSSSCHKRATTRQARTRCPAQPAVEQTPQTRQTRWGLHGRFDDFASCQFGSGYQELELQRFDRTKMGEHTAL